MKSIYKDETHPDVPRLALKPSEAAKAMSLSEKTLWSMSAPRGPIPCVHIGSRVLYPTHLLRKYLSREALRQQQDEHQTEESEGA
jgi:hypothetical protein